LERLLAAIKTAASRSRYGAATEGDVRKITLAKSIDTDETSVRPQDGYLPLICRFKPVIQITALAAGPNPTQLQSLSDAAVPAIEMGDSMRIRHKRPSAGRLFGVLSF
jgi:hypothetical protein